jgi:hypothetical protein
MNYQSMQPQVKNIGHQKTGEIAKQLHVKKVTHHQTALV